MKSVACRDATSVSCIFEQNSEANKTHCEWKKAHKNALSIFYKTQPIQIKFAQIARANVAQKCKRLLLHLNNASTLPCET